MDSSVMCDRLEDLLSISVSHDDDEFTINQSNNQQLDETELNHLAELIERFHNNCASSDQLNNQSDKPLFNQRDRFIRKSIVELAQLICPKSPRTKRVKSVKKNKQSSLSSHHGQRHSIQPPITQTVNSGTMINARPVDHNSSEIEQQHLIQQSNNQLISQTADQQTNQSTGFLVMPNEVAMINHSSFGLRFMDVTTSHQSINQSNNQMSDLSSGQSYKKACRRKFDYSQKGQVHEPPQFNSQSIKNSDEPSEQSGILHSHYQINQSTSKALGLAEPVHTINQSIEHLGNRKSLCYTENCRRPPVHHFFYHRFCESCAALNWSKRCRLINLTNWIVVLTGCRVKIGFCVGLRVLRGGGTLIGTSRFPVDTVRRYLNEKDSDVWKDRLHIYGLDLRDTKATHEFVRVVSHKYERIDCLINNAAQTIRRPVAYYKHLMEGESINQSALPPDWKDIIQSHDCHTQRTINQPIEQTNHQFINQSSHLHQPDGQAINFHSNNQSIDVSDNRSTGLLHSASAWLSQLILTKEDEQSINQSDALFPVNQLDLSGQQIDLRSVNSWALRLDEVDPIEFIEVCAINVISPFILTSGLRKVMTNRSPKPQSNNQLDEQSFNQSIDQPINPSNIPSYSHIVNVSAMEGKFDRSKSPYHPHTNMCKAALNMMTRTSAQDYAADRIWMNSVDTGWINDENALEIAKYNREVKGFHPPIDEEDAAARILDPIARSVIEGVHEWGKFLKDYQNTTW